MDPVQFRQVWKLVLDTKVNYLKALSEHYEKDPVISLEEVRISEKNINNHARSWVNIFNIGGSNGQKRRCTRALMSNFVMISSLEGLRKDCKPNIGGDPILGPKMRPLCAANRSPNAAFSHLVSMTIRALSNNIASSSGEIISSEELKSRI